MGISKGEIVGRAEWLLAESIYAELGLAQEALVKVDDLQRAGACGPDVDPEDDSYEIATHVLGSHIERALRAIGALAERLGISSIEREASAARQDRAELEVTSRPFEGEIHSNALSRARAFFEPLRAMTNAQAITAQAVLKNIIGKAAIILSDADIEPENESVVRNEVLKICKYSFPDAIREVGIPKIIKHYKGDLGIPSLRTMVEFKFVDSAEEMKSALDGVYADMKGYRHPDWDTFYGVFYMTGPYYVQEDVQREFEFVGADLSWTPIVVQGKGKRPAKTKT